MRSAASAPRATAGAARGELIVKFRRSATRAVAALQRVGRTRVVDERLLTEQVRVVRLADDSDATMQRALATLRARADVIYAEPNRLRRAYLQPNDELYWLQWNLRAVEAERAWDITVGSSDIVVAVVDSGIKHGHPDLAGRLVPGYDFVANDLTSGDGDGWDPNPDDPSRSIYHGTHVAGIIAASAHNGRGVAGIDWRCMIQPVRVLGTLRSGTDADVAAGIRWAAGLPVKNVPPNPTPARVINLSLGNPNSSTTLTDAVRAAIERGVIVIAAAGNDGISTDNIYPANIPGVITVGALEHSGRRAAYSNWGRAVDVMAPGGNIKQWLPDCDQSQHGDLCRAGVVSTMFIYGQDGGYAYQALDGTSQATPLVSGIVSLMLSVNRALTPRDALLVLRGSTDSRAQCPEGCGSGLIRADAAVRNARSSSSQSVGPGSTVPGATTTVYGGCSAGGGGGSGDAMPLGWLLLAVALGLRASSRSSARGAGAGPGPCRCSDTSSGCARSGRCRPSDSSCGAADGTGGRCGA
ncbi:MAG: S8 family serine peptidase [Myxococcales bacterium]|nr:S8 family serine peptidase [Myxococcales bacterium]